MVPRPQAIALLDALEAERQRADAICRDIRIQANDLKSAQTVNKALQAEIAELKGDQVPYAYSYNYAGCETCEGFQDWRKELSRERPPEWMIETGKVTDLFELFTAPQKPVVLLPVAEDYPIAWSAASVLADVKAAIEAAGGIVKDGE